MNNIQTLIDNNSYPPNHYYDYVSKKPIGQLAERLTVIKNEFPEFFTSKDRFLDVGCNKGFFLVYGLNYFNDIVGLEPDVNFYDICRLISHDNTNINVHHCSFLSYNDVSRFDRLFFGNVYHYIYCESGFNWSWVSRLSDLSNNGALVLIEGPISTLNPDVQKMSIFTLGTRKITSEELVNFDQRLFLSEMSKVGFDFVKQVNSPLVGRYYMLFKKI